MPILYSAVSEVDRHILTPLSKILSHKILADLQLTHVMQDNIYIDTGFSTVQRTQDHRHKAMVKQNQFKVTSEMNMNPSDLKWGEPNGLTSVGQGVSKLHMSRDQNLVFSDIESGIYLSEFIVPTTLTLQCNLLINDRALAYEIPAMIYRSYSPGTVFAEHIAYDYPIPKDLFSMLFSLYKLKRLDKETDYHTKTSFKDYLEQHTNKNIGYMVNRVLNRQELIASKSYINALVEIEYSEGKPNEVKSDKLVTQYEINFSYTMQFTRVDILALTFPHILDNRLLPEYMIKASAESTLDPLKSLTAPIEVSIYNKGSSSNNLADRPSENCIVFPFYDDWQFPSSCIAYKNSYRPYMIATVVVDEENEYTQETLNFLIDDVYELHPSVKSIMKKQGKFNLELGGIFYTNVYANDMQMYPDNLVLDEDLNLSIKVHDIRKTRRLVLTMITDLKYLNYEWIYNLDTDGLTELLSDLKVLNGLEDPRYVDVTKPVSIKENNVEIIPSTHSLIKQVIEQLEILSTKTGIKDTGARHVNQPFRISKANLIARRESLGN